MKAVITPGLCAPQAVRIPGSKSISHRALIAAALADGVSEISHMVKNEDTLATIACLSRLGAEIAFADADRVTVKGIRSMSGYHGEVLDCSESGSTLRFLIPLFSL